MPDDDDTCQPPPPTDLAAPDTSTVAEAGAWLSVRSATAQLGLSERTFYRRGFQKREVGGGQVEYWIPGGVAELAVDRLPPPLDPTEAALALYARVEELAAARQAPLLTQLAVKDATIREQAEELGKLRAELAAAQARPWWLFWRA